MSALRKPVRCSLALTMGLAVTWMSAAQAGGLTGAELEEIVVEARRLKLQGQPRAASEGTVLAAQIDNRPLLRVGELLEVVPGLIVTQHSGDGKANQYFLRGFNLDHGTDFATSVEGMPVNMPTHGHGQGYSDVNFVIPELVERISYRKGTYYAELGNFSAAGAAHIDYRASVERPFAALTLGENSYLRAVAAGSGDVGDGVLLAAAEFDRGDGPWELPENLEKYNGLLRFGHGDAATGFALAAMAYSGEWRSTDQIPRRAVRDGRLDRFGFVDPSDGGESSRYSLSGEWWRRSDGSRELHAAIYAIDYDMQLFSNFTYAIDPEFGDQFEQYDDRRVYGGEFEWSTPLAYGGIEHILRTGVQLRHDDIGKVGLYLTRARERHTTVRVDEVALTMSSAWASLASDWTPWLRSELGLRGDRFDFDVASSLAANSGSGHDTLASPKGSVTLGPWANTEFFLAAGRGFHSNDARGVTTRIDPSDGQTMVEPATPLVRATGSELGLRTALLPRTQFSLALFRLDLDSELLFIGDGGSTEATRSSRREGVEVGLFTKPFDWLIVDADYARARARFRDHDPAGNRIPGSIEDAASLGVAIDMPGGAFGGLRLRHLGPAPLIEDDSVRSDGTTLVNLEAGYRLSERYRVALQVLNLFDAEDDDITYYYESRLPDEAEPVLDEHFHPVEPLTLRVTLEARL